MNIIETEALTFDDVTIVPVLSESTSRKDGVTTTMLGSTSYSIPILASPMNTVTEAEMAIAMSRIGAGAIVHRYNSIADQVRIAAVGFNVARPNKALGSTFFAVGAAGDFLERAKALQDVGVTKFCVDVANGHSRICIKAVYELVKILGDDVDIMAGCVCTADGVERLAKHGAGIIRVGIGPGSMCTTRLVTGFGVPQITAVRDCAKAKDLYSVSIVSDGGIREAGDIVKAIAAGADAVIIGGLLAGTEQTPGATIKSETGELYKYYHGMASEEGRGSWFDPAATNYVPEGASTKVPFRGDAEKVVKSLAGGLQVGMSFANAKTLQELRENAIFRRVTDNGRKEGNPNKRLFK